MYAECIPAIKNVNLRGRYKIRKTRLKKNVLNFIID